jgi:hypothetical protein
VKLLEYHDILNGELFENSAVLRQAWTEVQHAVAAQQPIDDRGDLFDRVREGPLRPGRHRPHNVEVGLRVDVEKHMTAQPPRRIAKLEATIHMPAGIAEDLRDRLIRAANACPVKQSLHPDIEIALVWIW